KSRGTFILARTYLDAGLHADFLRYYFASMLGPQPIDVDLDLKAFEERINSHLIGKWVNIASRTAGFVHSFFAGKLAAQWGPQERNLGKPRPRNYNRPPPLSHRGDFAKNMRTFVLMTDLVNGYIANKAPWVIAKDKPRRTELHHVCTLALSAFRLFT